MASVLVSLSLFAVIFCTSAWGHSFLVYPQPMVPGACRRGDGGTCAGPCHADYNTREWTRYSPLTGATAASFGRGETFKLKYTRNNHTPGGFLRLALVPVEKTMDKAAHDKGTFHYSCWGAGFQTATKAELEPDQYGFSAIGSDGQQHSLTPGYYTVDVTIPPVVPDGKYTLGWSWFGGIGGASGEVKNVPQDGQDYSFFSDYWSCSYIEIVGGKPLASSFTPEFINTQSQFSEEGCKTAYDSLGQCSVESCTGKQAFYSKPASFQDGKTPADLTPETFGGAPVGEPTTVPPTTQVPTLEMDGSTTREVPTTILKTTAPAPTEATEENTTTEEKITTEMTPEATTTQVLKSSESSPDEAYLQVFGTDRLNGTPGPILSDGLEICPSSYSDGLTIVCSGISPDAGKVTFSVDGKTVRTESYFPYTIRGDYKGKFRSWENYPKVWFTLVCEAATGETAQARIRFSC